MLEHVGSRKLSNPRHVIGRCLAPDAPRPDPFHWPPPARADQPLAGGDLSRGLHAPVPERNDEPVRTVRFRGPRRGKPAPALFAYPGALVTRSRQWPMRSGRNLTRRSSAPGDSLSRRLLAGFLAGEIQLYQVLFARRINQIPWTLGPRVYEQEGLLLWLGEWFEGEEGTMDRCDVLIVGGGLPAPPVPGNWPAWVWTSSSSDRKEFPATSSVPAGSRLPSLIACGWTSDDYRPTPPLSPSWASTVGLDCIGPAAGDGLIPNRSATRSGPL